MQGMVWIAAALLSRCSPQPAVPIAVPIAFFRSGFGRYGDRGHYLYRVPIFCPHTLGMSYGDIACPHSCPHVVPILGFIRRRTRIKLSLSVHTASPCAAQ